MLQAVNGRPGKCDVNVSKDEEYQESLKQHKELKNPAEGGREQPRICDRHLKEEGMEKPIPHVNEGVLVQIGGPHPVSIGVVDGDVSLILRHLDGAWILCWRGGAPLPLALWGGDPVKSLGSTGST